MQNQPWFKQCRVASVFSTSLFICVELYLQVMPRFQMVFPHRNTTM